MFHDAASVLKLVGETFRHKYPEDMLKAAVSTSFRLALPSNRFHRQIGLYAGHAFDPAGTPMSQDQWQARRGEWLPDAADEAYVKSLMQPVTEPGKIAGWIAPPAKGINGLPEHFEYVKPA